MLTVEQEGSPLNSGSDIRALAYAANGECIVSGGVEGVRVWRVEDSQQMATMEAISVLCLAVSKDGRRIAAGTYIGDVFVWDAKTYEEVFSHTEDIDDVNGVDFSPDGTRLISASKHGTASIWDIAARNRAHTLDHDDFVTAAKYSPQGDRIATTTRDSVRVWDSNDNRLLADIKVKVTPWRNTGLLWFNNTLFVISDSKIKQFDASNGSTVSEWTVPESGGASCIALPKSGEFIAYSTWRTVTFWDTATHAQLGLIQHSQDICSIAVSPDDRVLAFSGHDGIVAVNGMFPITVSMLSRRIVVHVNNFLALIILP